VYEASPIILIDPTVKARYTRPGVSLYVARGQEPADAGSQDAPRLNIPQDTSCSDTFPVPRQASVIGSDIIPPVGRGIPALGIVAMYPARGSVVAGPHVRSLAHPLSAERLERLHTRGGQLGHVEPPHRHPHGAPHRY
jgi:hypothetical protein